MVSQQACCGPLARAGGESDTARTVRRALRVGFYAALARVALGLVKTVLLRRTLRARAIADAVLTLDPCKWACVLGGWALFPAVRAVVAAALRAAVDAAGAALAADGPSSSRRRLAVAEAAAEHTATAVAGAAAALPVLVMNVTTRTELGLYLAARALHGAAVTYLLPALPEPLATFRYYDVATIALTSVEMLYAMCCAPDTLAADFFRFLVTVTGKDKRPIVAAAAAVRRQLLPSTLEWCDQHSIRPPQDRHDLAALCRVTHHETPSCDYANVSWACHNLLTFGLPLYLPLKVGSAVVFHPRRVLQDPKGELLKAAVLALRSALFIVAYCMGPFRMMCLATHMGITDCWKMGVLGGLATTPAAFLEPRGRRLDIATYCVMQCIRSTRLLLYQRGYLSRPTRHQVLAMYVASVAFLFHQHTHTPETLNPGLRKGLHFVLGGAVSKGRGGTPLVASPVAPTVPLSSALSGLP